MKKGTNFKWFNTPISNSIYYFEVYPWPGSYFRSPKKHHSQINPLVFEVFPFQDI